MFLNFLNLSFYKNFDSKKFNFESKINCFIGKNGVGKSNVLDSTILSLESLDEEINELSIYADLSVSRLQYLKANLIKSQEDEYPHTSNQIIRHEM